MGEVKVESHNMTPTFSRFTSLSFHVDRASHSWLSYDFLKIWPWKSGVKVMGEVIIQSHKVGLTSYRLTSLLFHVNLASHCWVTTFSKFDLEIQGSRSWVNSKLQCGSHILSTHIPFVPYQSALPFLKYSIFKIWPWKSRVKVKLPWCCTTTGLDNSIDLWIHPVVPKIWVPQSLAQVLPDLTSFWPMGKPIRGKWANNYHSAQLQD